MKMDPKKTYWSNNGKFQKESESLDALIPSKGEMAKGSPIECLRVLNNSYYDLYNNGAGNTEIRGPEFLDMLKMLQRNNYLPDRPEVRSAVNECVEFVNEYMEVHENGGPRDDWGWSGDEDDEEEYQEEVCYPSHHGLYDAYEVLADAIIEMNMAVKDPTVPLRDRPKYQNESSQSMSLS